MTAKNRDRVKAYWPVITTILFAAAFGGMWYQRTCSLETTVQAVATDVSDLKQRTTKIETSVSQTRDDVKNIADHLFRRSIAPTVSQN